MVHMSTRDYYEVLGVSRNANSDEIKKAFRKTAAKLHPDNKDTGNEAAFKELVTAYEVLSDEEKRAIYDKYGAEGLKRGGGSATQFSDFDFSAFGGLDDLLEFLMGGGMRGRGGARGGPARGEDLRYDLELEFHEAVFGVQKDVTIKHLRPCTGCSGTGAAAGSKPVLCTGCGGHGQVRQTTSTFFGHFSQITVCPSCNGEGSKVDKACDKCDGKALVRKSRTLKDLQIPAGVDNGTRIRVPQEGNAGRKGAGPGDLYVICRVREHERFIREGTTIHLKQSISPSMAALGGEMWVETVGGKRILKIAPGTQTGTVMVMKGEGVPFLNSERRGDQQVHIFVEVPTRLSEEEKQLYRKLAELKGEHLVIPESEKPVASKDDKEEKKEHHSIFDAIAGVFKGKTNAE